MNDTARVWRTWSTVDDLIAFARTCCVVRTLTAVERAAFNLLPGE